MESIQINSHALPELLSSAQKNKDSLTNFDLKKKSTMTILKKQNLNLQ